MHIQTNILVSHRALPPLWVQSLQATPNYHREGAPFHIALCGPYQGDNPKSVRPTAAHTGDIAMIATLKDATNKTEKPISDAGCTRRRVDKSISINATSGDSHTAR